MPDLNWPEDGPIITDAEFRVIRGAYEFHDEHPERPGWRFTGHYDQDGDPLWHNMEIGQKHPKNPRAEFIGLFDKKCRPLYYIRPRFLPEWLQDPITICGWTWHTKGGFIAGMVFVWVPAATFLGIGLVVVALAGLRDFVHGLGLH